MEQKNVPQIVSEVSFSYREKFTYADYLRFSYEEMVDLIRGKIYRMSPGPNSYHQVISRNITGILYPCLKAKKLKFFNDTFNILLPVKGKTYVESDKVVQPDFVVSCHPELINEGGYLGAPDWTIENLSPDTTKKMYN